ncbi:MAG: outer membrane protein [Bacteroidales bacterium]
MKAKLVLFFLLINCSLAYSQIVKSIGIKTGVSLSNQDWLHTAFYDRNFEVLPGVYGAITADIVSKEFWELSLDLGYYQSRSKNVRNKYSLNTQETNYDINFRFDFITISPILRFKTKLKAFTPYIFTGPRMDYYIPELNNDNIIYFKEDINKPIFGFTIGEGLAYGFKNISIFAEYQFFYSFTYLIDQPALFATSTISRDRVKFNSHIINLGIKYHFKNKD